MKVIKNGEKVEMAYAEICHDLGFYPQAEFVRITNRGTIAFYCGHPDEVRALLRKANEKGYKPAQSLIAAVENFYG